MTTDIESPVEERLARAEARIRQLEEQLAEQSAATRAAERALHQVLEHAPVVFWEIDRDGIFTRSEGRGLQTLGLTSGQVVGTSAFELYREQPQIVASLRKALEGQEQQLLVDAGSAYFESWFSPKFNSQGEVCGARGVASDITSRVRAEEAERSSSARFLTAFHSSPAAILLTDLQTGRIIDINTEFCRQSGYSREELVGKTTVELGFWPDWETRIGTLKKVLERSGQCRFNYRLPTRSGERRLMKNLVENVELDGRPCALSIMRDAGRERRMKQALRRSRQRYQTLARLAPVGIFHAARDGQVTYVNEHCCQLFNRSRVDLVKQGWWDAIADEDRESVCRQWETAVTRRESVSCEFRTRPDESGQRWLLLRLEPASSDGFLGSLADITRRKLAELDLQRMNQRLEENVRLRTELLVRTSKSLEEQIFERRRTYEDLEKSEQRWRSLVEDAPDVILLLDRDGRIEYVNHTRGRPGLAVEQVIGRSAFDFAYEAYHDDIRRVLELVFDEQQSVTHEVQGPGENGRSRWYQSHLAPIEYNGRVIGATAIVRDVTEVRQKADELRQTQDLLAHAGRVSMVGEMTAGFAHELGQPLFAISSYINGCLIRLQRGGGTDPEVIQAMEDAVNEAHRSIEVVKRLREFLQRHEMQRTPTDLNQAVADAVRLADAAMRRHRVHCQIDLATDLPRANLDRIQIMQVLVNLLLNAAEAMAEVAEPRLMVVRTRSVDGQVVECEVEDRGPGLPAGLANAIFEPFFTTKPDGLGLGLSISRSIVEAHGGKVVVANAPQGGAVFTVRLPC